MSAAHPPNKKKNGDVPEPLGAFVMWLVTDRNFPLFSFSLLFFSFPIFSFLSFVFFSLFFLFLFFLLLFLHCTTEFGSKSKCKSQTFVSKIPKIVLHKGILKFMKSTPQIQQIIRPFGPRS